MDGLTYSAFGFLAVISLFIINYQVLTSQTTRRDRKAYKSFVIAVLLYSLSDTAWGILSYVNNTQLLLIDTVLIYLFMTVTVTLCCRYILIFLDLHNFVRKHVFALGLSFLILAVTLLVINRIQPLFFYIDENDQYRVGDFRPIVLLTQTLWFAMMSIFSWNSYRNTHNNTRNRKLAICLFGFSMTLASIAQYYLPLAPMNTVGFLFGMLIVHVFVHQEEDLINVRELSRLKTMMEATGIGTWQLRTSDGKPTRLLTDNKMKELMGLSADSGITDEEAFVMLQSGIHPDDLPAFMEYDSRLKNGERTEVTYRWKHPNDGYIYVRCGGAITKLDNEEVCQGYHYDVTDQITKAKALEDSIAANKAKTKFLQNMSHEIRTPLNAMFGFAQLLGMPDGSWTEAEREKYNSYIYNSYNMLEMLINDILDVADSENGNYRMVMSDVCINNVCRNALMSVEFRCPAGVEMKFTSDLSEDYMMTTDARRIQQVLINYLTNACKNTVKGFIHLHCSSTEKPGRVTFSVTDTGKGVPPEKADEIFGRFTKLDQFVQGSGLGLNICHTIASKLGGEVYLDTAYTGGARFVFIL